MRALTTTDAARYLAVHTFTVGRYVDQGLVRCHRTAGGLRRIMPADLARYLRDRGQAVPPELFEDATPGTLKLLVLDPAVRTPGAVARAFRPFGARVAVTTARSAIEALLIAGALRPDALLMDMRLTDADPFALCARVLAFPRFSRLKVIGMAASLKTDVLGSALRAGAVACLEKPVDPEEVLALLAPTPGAGARPR